MDPSSPLPDDSAPIPTAPSALSSQQQSLTPKFSNGLHIRSRITVVCAECKRLKLRCDRRNPCGSCVKRDTVQRCQYTAAAAEKIDVQSLHNRLQIVESQIAQIYAGGIRVPTVLASVSSDNFPFSHNDRNILAVGCSGSSVIVSLDDVAALWLEYLDLPRSCPAEVNTSCTSASASPSTPMRLEPHSSELAVHDEPAFTAAIPPFTIYFPLSTSQAAVTSSLVALLPSSFNTRARISMALEETMKMHPCFNIKHFRSRAENMVAWAKDEDGRGLAGASASSSNAKAELARSIFFPTPSPPVAPISRPTPTLSFFASVAVAYALGVLVCKENEITSDIDAQKASTGPKNPRLEDNRTGHPQKAPSWSKYSASGLFTLSRQAMAAFELAHTYDLDAVVAYLLQIVYLLHDSRPRVAHIIYPLLGKLIHIAHMMGLSTDPDEFPGTYSLFEAEQRRRVWWDIYYYDVFISDAMGQVPSIQDGTYTTKLPADVDEEQFGPSSTSLPLPLPRRAGGDPTEVGFAYFIQKCRLAQLVKSVKRRCPRDNPNDSSESSIERAEQFESEVKTWLLELPKAFRFDINNTETTASSSRVSVSPNLQAQRCELAIIANQLILKVFLPYLKNCTGPSSDGLPRRVVSSVIDAGHTIFQAMRILHSTWRQTQPAAFLFYSLGRTLFDTAVMMACAVIAHPSSASSSVAIDDVTAAIDIMEDTRMGSGRKSKHDDRGDLPEVVKIITLLKTKAEAKLAGDDIVAGPPSTGSKRKHDESPDCSSFADNFELPYVGGGVKASHSSPEPSVETTPKAPISVPKAKVKHQRSGSALPSDSCRGSEGLQLADRDAGQIPVRGRPRTEPTLQQRNTSSKKYNSTSASTQSQSVTPASDKPGFHPTPAGALPEARPQMCSSDYDASIYPTSSSGYESSAQLASQFSIPPSMPPPYPALMLASPGYASMSGSNSSSQSSPAYSQGHIASPHAFGQPGPELYNIQGPATPSYDSPLAGIGMTVGEPQSHHSSVPPEEPPFMMGPTDPNVPNVQQVSFPPQQNGAIGLQNLQPSFGPPHGLLSTSAWQPDDGLPPRQNTGDAWQDYGKFHH